MGMDFFYCFKRHFLPKILPVVATLSAFGAGNAVLALATLGFVDDRIISLLLSSSFYLYATDNGCIYFGVKFTTDFR